MLAPLPDFKALARDIQNRNNHIIGTDQMEARHFREFFGTSLIVVEKVWEMLETNFLLPDGCGLARYVGCRRVIFVAQMATFCVGRRHVATRRWSCCRHKKMFCRQGVQNDKTDMLGDSR